MMFISALKTSIVCPISTELSIFIETHYRHYVLWVCYPQFILNEYNRSRKPVKHGFPEGETPLDNLMVVPIISAGSVVAVAAVANRDSDSSSAIFSSLKKTFVNSIFSDSLYHYYYHNHRISCKIST